MYLLKRKQAVRAGEADCVQVPCTEPAWNQVLQSTDDGQPKHSEPRAWEPINKNVVDDWILKASSSGQQRCGTQAQCSHVNGKVKEETDGRGRSIVYEAPSYGVVLVDAPQSRASTKVLSQLVPSVFHKDIEARFCRILVRRKVGLPLTQMLRKLQSVRPIESALFSKMVVVIIDGADFVEDDAAKTAIAIKTLVEQGVDVVCSVDDRYAGARSLREQLTNQNIPVTMTELLALTRGCQQPFFLKAGRSRGQVDGQSPSLPRQDSVLGGADFQNPALVPVPAVVPSAPFGAQGNDADADAREGATNQTSNGDAKPTVRSPSSQFDLQRLSRYVTSYAAYRALVGKRKRPRDTNDYADEDRRLLEYHRIASKQ